MAPGFTDPIKIGTREIVEGTCVLEGLGKYRPNAVSPICLDGSGAGGFIFLPDIVHKAVCAFMAGELLNALEPEDPVSHPPHVFFFLLLSYI